MKKRILLFGALFLAALISIGTILFILYLVPICFGGKYPAIPDPLPPETLLTQEQVTSDRDLAIQFIEDAHPYFILQNDLTAYEQVRQAYIDLASTEMTVSEFQTLTAQYLCFFRDGHTRTRWVEEEYLALKQRYLDGKSYLVENGTLSDKYIVQIGNVPINDIYKTIDRCFPAENDMAQQCNRENYIIGRNLLRAAGAQTDSDTVTVSLSDGSSSEFPFIRPSESESVPLPAPTNTWQMIDDVFLVNFVECTEDKNLRSIAEALENALQQGCCKVIIDARGNGGGNSNACELLLSAMNMTAPEFDMAIRYSPEAKEQIGYPYSSGIYRHQGSDESRANENVHLAVLCDRYTFSSANMLCVWVRDGGLGVIIGEPSPNSPSHYGDILYLSLPHSHIFATVSHKRFVRPDEDNTENMLVPDIRTTSDEAYQRALEYMDHIK